jgi:hypothetical protein
MDMNMVVKLRILTHRGLSFVEKQAAVNAVQNGFLN